MSAIAIAIDAMDGRSAEYVLHVRILNIQKVLNNAPPYLPFHFAFAEPFLDPRRWRQLDQGKSWG